MNDRADHREQALLELSLREIYAKTTLFYYGGPGTPPSASAELPRPVTPPKLALGPVYEGPERPPPPPPSPSALEDGEIDEDGDVTPDARASKAPPRRLFSWEIAEQAPPPPPRELARPRKKRRRALSNADDGISVIVAGDDSGGFSSDEERRQTMSY